MGHDRPKQAVPLPRYPELHVHVYDVPLELQSALTLHGSALHGSITAAHR